ncbi:MAG: RtcB family protein [Acidobacteria bacterium]|nr:RtcB family protein [Acidobacteriota bacterium]
MFDASHIQRLDDYRYLIPKASRSDMRSNVVVYANKKLWAAILKDQSLEQAVNVATLPGIVGNSLAMPDIHQGYGFPIGGVAATDYKTGVVSPGGVGFDINCGVRLLASPLTKEQVQPRIQELVNQLFRDVPCGAGKESLIRVSGRDLDRLLEEGATWMVEHGYGEPADLEYAEERGCMKGADANQVSARAKHRGGPQAGSLGSGNHFLEIQYVDKVFDAELGTTLGLSENQIVVLIHTGSRGLGHQVCTDYLAQMGAAMKKYNIALPDRQLACVPIHSPEGQAYLGAMNAAANFAWANRQTITHFVREAIHRLFGKDAAVRVVYDIAHNMAKRERHTVEGNEKDVLVHRKGATRAFPPGHPEIPARYRSIGQPVLIPGSMGTASWVLVGAPKAMDETFGSVCHGAGRMMSRTAAKKGRDINEVRAQLERKGIYVKSQTRDGILEEIPEAYKDVDEVVEVVHQAGLARKAVRLVPIGVLKG